MSQSNDFYWQSSFNGKIQAFIEIHPIKYNRLTSYYWDARHQETCRLIGELFLQRNIPVLIGKGDKNYLSITNRYDERDDAKLHLWSKLCERPSTHCLTVGYLAGNRKKESVKLTLSFNCVGSRQPWAVQLSGKVISRLLSESKDHFFLTSHKSNSEFWLQCVFAVVSDIRES